MPTDLSTFNSPTGPAAGDFAYETIDYDGRLELLDADSRVARFHRRQTIRFLADGVGTFFDRVWGDGVLFAGYHAEHMNILETVPTRNGYVVALGLPRFFLKGETFEIKTERKIVGGFPGTWNHWDSAMQAPTQTLKIDVIAAPGLRFRRPEIIAPRVGNLHAKVHGETFHLYVKGPALYTPYKLTWLKK